MTIFVSLFLCGSWSRDFGEEDKEKKEKGVEEEEEENGEGEEDGGGTLKGKVKLAPMHKLLHSYLSRG